MAVQGANIDRGYSWVVLSAAFGIQFLVGMLIFNVGAMTSAILEEIDSDLTRTSWVGATLNATITLLGPFVGIFNRKFGARVTTCVGGLITFSGLTAASFTRTVPGLLGTYSFLSGCGFALSVNVAGSVPGHYFDKKRPIAFAVSMSGGGCGMFLGAPLIRYLLETYYLSGTILILGALSFHICIAGLIIRDQDSKSAETANESFEELPIRCTKDPTKPCGSDSSVALESESKRLMGDEDTDEKHQPEANKFTKENIESKWTIQKSSSQAVDDNGAHVLDTTPSGESRKYKLLQNHFSIAMRSGFIVYVVSILFWSIGESSCYLHLPNYAASKGNSPTESSTLFTIMGIMNVISKILAGFAATDPAIGYYLLHMGMLGMGGLITLLFPLMSNQFYLQCIYAAIFGLQMGGPNSLLSPITIDLIGLSAIEVGFGMLMFSFGIGFLVGAPLASLCMILASVCGALLPMFKGRNSSQLRQSFESQHDLETACMN
ncbi:monocarboxylate transporter 12-like isoform X2 [Haliotis rubra]|uniref:monocarboxylate transporter 12-like isoform X2 n=1 Tax=Haliotis rubra TaxID=36100 RepID=UPI001EE54CDC|nr:monocarboxylate transporter 12-like isoform X2 [Haliotis rubra]